MRRKKEEQSKLPPEIPQDLPLPLTAIFEFANDHPDDVSSYLDLYELGFWLMTLVEVTNPKVNPPSFANPYGDVHFSKKRIDLELQNILTKSGNSQLYQTLIDWVKNELSDDSLENCKIIYNILWSVKKRVAGRTVQKDEETQRKRKEWYKLHENKTTR